MQKVELLAPAGSKDAFIGAINAGADAIYLSGKRFGARAYANNFDDEEMIESIRYAHLFGVRVFVAINTLIFNDEIDELLVYTDFLVSNQVDALIIQDLGMIYLMTKRYPDTEIHVSTQFNTHNIHQVKVLKDLGVKRIVLGRETSLKTIRAIKREVDIELEVFIHGALCVSYSGNCLMSSMIGGRSGNRGECAQTCRLPYELYKDKQMISDQSYLLSTKDLMTIDYIDELIEAKIDSFKIEGRMRKPEYVVETVKAYRKAIDMARKHESYVKTKDIDRLTRVFNRSFTKGFILDEVPRLLNASKRPNHQGVPLGRVISNSKNRIKVLLEDDLRVGDGYRLLIDDEDRGDTISRILKNGSIVNQAKANDVVELDVKGLIKKDTQLVKTTDIQIESEARHYLNEHNKKILLNCHITAKTGSKLSVICHDSSHVIKVQSIDVIEKAINQPTMKEEIEVRFQKLGQTPFVISNLIVDCDVNLFIPVKMINDLKREMVEKLTNQRINQQPKRIQDHLLFPSIALDAYPPKLFVKVRTKAQHKAAQICGIEQIIIEDTLVLTEGKDKIISLKRIQTDQKKTISYDAYVHDIGVTKYNFDGHNLFADQFLNVTNVYSAYALYALGFKRVTLSVELSKVRALQFADIFMKTFRFLPELDLISYGIVDLMLTKYCPIAKTFQTNPNCHLCERDQYYLKDRMNQFYPLVHDGNCNLRILHSKPLHLYQDISAIKQAKISGIRLDFTVENYQECENIITFYQQLFEGQTLPNPLITYTVGRWQR